ncbi:hypothetical protein OPIT5_22510 [Opitutaceae bacterium TAV5]|nr:hypothetical protein OPIT5_22510 [Opitutaceae bacterium TAV5]
MAAACPSAAPALTPADPFIMRNLIIAAGLAAAAAPLQAAIPVGRGEISAQATAKTTYDSNVFGTHDATDDFSGTLTPRVTYLRQSGLIQAEVDAGISFIRFLDHDELDADNLDLSATLWINDDEVRNYSGSLAASYRETSDVDIDINNRVNTDTTTFSGQAGFVLGPRSDLSLNASHTDSERSIGSDQQTLATGMAFDYKDFFYGNSLRLAANYDELQSSGDNARGSKLDQSSWMLTAGLNRTFAHDLLHASLSYGYRVLTRSRDETDKGIRRQSGSVITASLDGPFLPRKHFPKVESHFSVSYQDAASPGINDTGSKTVTGSLGVIWQARETTRVSLSANRSQRLSADDLSVVTTTVQLGVHQDLRTNLTGSLTAGYDWSTYDDDDGRRDKTASFGALLNYRFARAWDAELSARFNSTSSTVLRSDYDRLLVSLGVTYHF